mmetsp:Transcript_300/g.558  ORF Transcript_300/g.558 Transcript_300/m.558 type:complete len:546 (-) Transcript_300:164-1801(-)
MLGKLSYLLNLKPVSRGTSHCHFRWARSIHDAEQRVIFIRETIQNTKENIVEIKANEGSLLDSDKTTTALKKKLISCMREGRLDEALEIYEQAAQNNFFKPQILILMIRILLDPEIHSLNPLLTKEVRLAKAFEILKIQESLQDANEALTGTYAVIIRGLIDLNAPDKIAHSQLLIDKMKAKNLRITARILEPILKLACEEGNLQLGFEAWERMKEDEVYIHEKQHLHMLRLCASKCPGRISEILEHMKESFSSHGKQASYFTDRTEVENQLDIFSDIFNGLECQIRGHVVRLNADNYCPACKSTPQNVRLTVNEKKTLRTSLLKTVAKVCDRFSAKSCLQLGKFARFLDSKGPENVTAIIDGANIAYIGHHLQGSSLFKPQQIDTLCSKLEEEGLRVLIVLPARYTHKSILKKHPNLKMDETLDMFKRWNEEEKLYLTPVNVNDDWFWLYAGVAFDDSNPLVVTNDKMRDHHHLLPFREFLKFEETQVARIEVVADAFDPKNLVKPSSISKHIQEFSPGKWHIPNLMDPAKREWFCLDLGQHVS